MKKDKNSWEAEIIQMAVQNLVYNQVCFYHQDELKEVLINQTFIFSKMNLAMKDNGLKLTNMTIKQLEYLKLTVKSQLQI